jgi:predicted Abi (CAAX) family protease
MTDDPEAAFETERRAAQELLADDSITALYVGVVSDGDALETTLAQTADDPQQEGLQALSLLAAHVRLVANEAGVEPAAVAGDAATLAGRMDELSPEKLAETRDDGGAGSDAE